MSRPLQVTTNAVVISSAGSKAALTACFSFAASISAGSGLAATTVGRTETALGAFYRRLSARIGKAKAVTATARKIAVLFYNAVRHGMDYTDPGASYYEERYRQRVLTNLQRRAKAFGYVLQPTEIKVVSMAVS